jgi:hypothetical protein
MILRFSWSLMPIRGYSREAAAAATAGPEGAVRVIRSQWLRSYHRVGLMQTLREAMLVHATKNRFAETLNPQLRSRHASYHGQSIR